MKKKILLILLGGIFLLCMNFQVFAQTETTTLELTVRQVLVEEDVASISGLVAGSKVELYDNLGEELIDSGTSDANGKIIFPLDDQYPLSGKGLYHTVVKVDGVSNGDFTCQQGQTCQETLFTIEGLKPDMDDGILIVKVVRSGNPYETVGGIKVYAWPADGSGNPIPEHSIRVSAYRDNINYYEGVPCITDQEGYCAANLRNYFIWTEDVNGNRVSKAVIYFGNELVYDWTTIELPEGGLSQVTISVDEKGNLDDCVLKTPPTDLELSHSCMEKLHKTATAQVQVTPDKAALETMNNAIVQASMLSKDTADLFAAHQPDQIQIDKMVTSSISSQDPESQIKLILRVNNISVEDVFFNNVTLVEHTAIIGGIAFGKTVAIYKQDDPAQLLGACMVNSLGECVILLDRINALDTDHLIKFRVLADRYDNGILVCEDQPVCEQRVYTVSGLTGENDAVLLIKVVREDDLTKPVQGIPIIKRWAREKKEPVYGNIFMGCDGDCYTDMYGAFPIYISKTGYIWINEGSVNYAIVNVFIGASIGNDSFYLNPRDDRLNIYYAAVDKNNKMVDCTFTSPLTYFPVSPVASTCEIKKKALQTAIAGYTATPTVTITPLPSATPTATEIPPTPTITLTPSPTLQPGVSDVFSNSRGVFIAVGVLIVLIVAGLGVYLWKRKSH